MRCLLACLALAALTGLATAQATPDQLWWFQGIEDINAFASLPDVDGDGVDDIVVETYDAGADGDHLFLLSGLTGATIWSVRPESGASNGGGDGQECLVVCDDLSGDGFPDVLLGTAWGNCSVHAVDGLTGAVLWTFDTYDEPNNGWVYAVRAHPDRTGDGRPEVVFGVGSENHRGYLLDGSDGSVIWRFIGSYDAIGFTASLPDVNGDAVADVLFCGWDNEDRVFCVSGAGAGAGAQIWNRDNGGTNYSATVVDDISDDGVAEVVVGLWSVANQVVCLDGATGVPRWTFNAGSYNYIMRVVTVDDVDGDGARDVAVGSWDNGLRVISGRDGTLIWISYAGTLNGGDFWTVDGVDDLDGDGIGEVVGGSFDHLIYLFSGADGATLWTFETADRLFAVFGGPDISNNGAADVLGGTQYLSSGGRAHALEGGDSATAVPDLPEASGRAVAGAGRVTLTWQLSSPLPCVVDRLVEHEDKALRTNLARDFEAGRITTREVLTVVRGGDKDAGTRRLTAVPMLPDADGYTLVDTTAPVGAATYRIAAVLPDGRELTLLHLRPDATDLPGPSLSQVRISPNPFNPRAEIGFAIDHEAEVTVDVLDARGRCVASLGRHHLAAGQHRLTWDGDGHDGRALPAGVYLFRVRAGAEAMTVKAALVR